MPSNPKYNVAKGKNARLVLYVVYSRFGVPFGVSLSTTPSKMGGWPNINFKNLHPSHLGAAKSIYNHLLLLQTEKIDLTPSTIEIFETLCEIARPRVTVGNLHPILYLNKLMPMLLKKVGNQLDRRVAKLLGSQVVYYAGKPIKNNRVSAFLTAEREGDSYNIIDLLSGRSYKPEDLLTEKEFLDIEQAKKAASTNEQEEKTKI